MKKKTITIILLVITIIMSMNVTVNAKTSDYQIVKSYCKTHYPNCKIVLLKSYNAKKIEHRKGKNIVYVELCKSVSSGKKDSCNGRYWGYIKGDNFYRCWYNTKVKKGKTVKQYWIYNPYTNYEDDIVAVVDNKKIR